MALLLPLWGQRVYPLHGDLVVNGGFEDQMEIVGRCTVEVPTHTGARARLFYPAFTPRYSSLGVVPYMWDYRYFPSYFGRGVSEGRRDLPYRRVRGPDSSLPYLPLRYAFPRCHEIGGQLGVVPQEDSTAWNAPDTLWVSSSAGGVEPGWGAWDTLAAEGVEGSFLLPVRHWSGRGLQWGVTRRTLQGLLHFAPYWVSTVGHPQFFFYPEYPQPILSNWRFWRYGHLTLLSDRSGFSTFVPSLFDSIFIQQDVHCCRINVGTVSVQRHGYDWIDYYKFSTIMRFGQLGWRYGYPDPRWSMDTVERWWVPLVPADYYRRSWLRGKSHVLYRYFHLNPFNGVYMSVYGLLGGRRLFPHLARWGEAPEDREEVPEGISMGFEIFKDTSYKLMPWTFSTLFYAAFNRSVWYPSEEDGGSFLVNNLVPPVDNYSSSSVDGVLEAFWRRGEPWGWMDRRGVWRYGAPWYVQRAGTYGVLWEMGNVLWFPPVRALGGMPMNRPLWHHRRLGAGIGVVKASPQWHRLGVEAVKVGGPCGELAPYRGEGYITISYPVRYFHGFRGSEGYRAWLRGVDRRYGIGEGLARELWYYGGWLAYDSVEQYYRGVRRYADSVWRAAWDSAVSWVGVRCGSPVFLTDPFMWALWEGNRAWVEEMYRDFRWPEVRRDSLRGAMVRCCGGLWNGRGEEGGVKEFRYDSGWGLRVAWVYGPMQKVLPTGRGCPDTARLVGWGLDPECSEYTYCVGRCPEAVIGPSGGDSAAVENEAVQVAGYYRWVGRKQIYHNYLGLFPDSIWGLPRDSLSPFYVYRPIYEVVSGQVIRRVPPQEREWLGYATLGFVRPDHYFGDYFDRPADTVSRLPLSYPERTVNWARTATGTDVWWRGYRIGERGCYVSLNHGPVESCCGGWGNKVNRAYAVMGYLKEPLEAGKRYRVRLAVAVPRRSVYVIHNVGVVVSTEPFPNVYPYCRGGYVAENSISWESPEYLSKARWSWWENSTVRLDTAIGRWVVLEGTLVALGGERFIYVGWLDSTRLDTQFIGFDEDRYWRNGVSTCGAGLVSDSLWERWYGGSRVSRGLGYMEWWVNGGDGGLHVDEVGLWDDEAGGSGEGECVVWDGVCGVLGRGEVRMRGGTAPYDCIWYRDGRRVLEGCRQEGLVGGWYQVVVVDSAGREWRGWVEVRVYDTLWVSVDTVWDVEDRPGGAVVRVGGGAPPYVIEWVGTGQVGDTLWAWAEGRYVAVVRDSVGCEKRVEVEVRGRNAVWVPSAFSPNGDGVNDEVWPVVRYEGRVRDMRWVVYDRWGKVVYEGRGVGSRWDGRYKGEAVPEDVYVVYVWVWFEGRNAPVEYKGTITVVR